MGVLKKGAVILSIGIAAAIAAGYYGNKYAILGVDDGDYTKNTEVAAPYKQCIDENTVIEFIYNYSDGFSNSQYTLPENYMIGYDKQQLMNIYKDWQMESFSPNKVIFEKSINDDSPYHYILKEHKGYVGVFYKKSGMLKEITSTPIASLSENDKKRYEAGIEIDGEENLAKFIENLET